MLFKKNKHHICGEKNYNIMSTIELKYNVIDQIIKISPSGDKYWANPKNVEALDKALDMLKDPNNKPVAVLESEDDIRNYINSL